MYANNFDLDFTIISDLLISSKSFCDITLHCQIQKLQRVQNAAARIITGIKKYDHITPALKELHWLPVQQRIEFKILLLTYKALNNMAPSYITSMFTMQGQERYSLRSNASLQLKILRTNTKRAETEHFQSLLLHYGTAYLITFVTRRALILLNLG